MQMRAGHSSSRSDESDPLSARNRVACRDQRFAQVEIGGYDSAAVIDVHDVAGEKEIVDERDDSAVRGPDRLSDCAPEIDTKMAAGHAAVEETSRSKLTRDYGRPRAKKGSGPHRR
jgi:hypothetical protein